MKTLLAALTLSLTSLSAHALSHGETRNFSMQQNDDRGEPVNVALSYRYNFNGGTFDACDVEATMTYYKLKQPRRTATALISLDLQGKYNVISTEATRVNEDTVRLKFSGCVPGMASRYGVPSNGHQRIEVMIDNAVVFADDAKMAW